MSGDMLRQWYTKYHPDSGPIKYETAQALEEGMGAHLRDKYPGMKSGELHTVLGMRLKAVLVSRRVVETWITKYAPQSAAPVSSSSILKRPAAAMASRPLKRPAAAAQPADEFCAAAAARAVRGGGALGGRNKH